MNFCINCDFPIRTRQFLLWVLLTLFFMVFQYLFLSYDVDAANDKISKKASFTVRAKVYDQLQDIQNKIENSQFNEVKKQLDEIYLLRERMNLNPVELAYTYNFYGYYYFSIEDLNKAKVYYKKVIDTEEISTAMKLQSLYTLGQIEFSLENYGQSLEFLSTWFHLKEKPSGDAHVLIAQIYYQLKNIPKAMKFVDQAIDIADMKGKIPKENWLRLQAAVYFDSQDLVRTAMIYKRLVSYYFKKSYLIQLSGLYRELNQPSKQLSILQSAYRIGWLRKETDLLNYSYILLAHDLPYEAAVVIEKAIKGGVVKDTYDNTKLLGNAFYQAHEFKRSVPYLEKAAELSESGSEWVMLASSFLHLEDYKMAQYAAKSSLEKEKLEDPGMSYILLGTAELNLNNFTNAKNAFNKALEFENTREFGNQWLSFTESEVQKHEFLAGFSDNH